VSFRILLCEFLLVVVLSAYAACAHAGGPSELRIGYQKSSVNLLIARHLGSIEQRFPGTRVRHAVRLCRKLSSLNDGHLRMV
jgi:hypothetical protein